MRLESFFAIIKRKDISLNNWFFSFFSIVFIRTFLEYICEYTHRLTPSGNFYHNIVDLAHISLSWLCVYLSVTVVLNLFDRSTFVETAKVVLCFFPVIIIVPLLDYFVFQSGKILYEGSFDNFWYKFIYLFDFMKDMPNITNGVRVELFFVTCSVFTYIYVIRKNIFLSLLSSFFVYSIIFFYGYLPAVINKIFHTDYMQIVHDSILPMQSIGNLNFYSYIPIFFILVIYIMFKIDKKYRYMILDSFRVERLSIYLGLFLFGFIAGVKHSMIENDFYNIYDILKVSMATTSLIFSFVYAALLNNIYDIKIDRLSNTTRALIKYKIPLHIYREYKNMTLFFALFFALGVNGQFWIIIVFLLSLSYIYSAYPFRIKRFFIISNLLLTLIALFVFLLGFSVVEGNGSFLNVDHKYLQIIFLFFFFSSSLKDIKDVYADRQYDIITLPILLGTKKAFILIKVLTGATLLYVLYILKIEFYYSLFISFFYIISSYTIKNSEKFLFSIQVIALLIYILVFYGR